MNDAEKHGWDVGRKWLRKLACSSTSRDAMAVEDVICLKFAAASMLRERVVELEEALDAAVQDTIRVQNHCGELIRQKQQLEGETMKPGDKLLDWLKDDNAVQCPVCDGAGIIHHAHPEYPESDACPRCLGICWVPHPAYYPDDMSWYSDAMVWRMRATIHGLEDALKDWQLG